MKKIPVPPPLPAFEPVPYETYCSLCPGPLDPEVEDYMALPEGERQKHVHACGLRQRKLCRQVCELMDYDPKKHAHLILGRKS